LHHESKLVVHSSKIFSGTIEFSNYVWLLVPSSRVQNCQEIKWMNIEMTTRSKRYVYMRETYNR